MNMGATRTSLNRSSEDILDYGILMLMSAREVLTAVYLNHNHIHMRFAMWKGGDAHTTH
jgi:hypothetical protein